MLSEVVLYISPDIASTYQIKQRHLCVYMTCGDGVIKSSKFKLTFFSLCSGGFRLLLFVQYKI